MDNCERNLLEEEKKDFKKFKEDSMEEKPECQKSKRDIEELKTEEKMLNNYLETLRKENFSLQASIDSWQITLNKKLNQFRESESELMNLYKLIWSERENFCAEADKFDNERGVLSNWWKTQMEFVSDLNKLHEKRAENKKNKEEIELLQKKVEGTKGEIDCLLKGTHNSMTAICFSEDEEDNLTRKEKEMVILNKSSTSQTSSKKVKFASEVDYIEIYPEKLLTPKNKLFSMMDINKMKMANRKRNIALRKSQSCS